MLKKKKTTLKLSLFDIVNFNQIWLSTLIKAKKDKQNVLTKILKIAKMGVPCVLSLLAWKTLMLNIN